MVICSGCGHKMNDEARFCSACGQSVAVGDNSQRRQVFEGVIHKCPNCGEVVEAFSIKCSSCGFEFRDVKSSSKVEEFAEKLRKIESRRPEKNIFTGIAELFGARDTTDDQKVNLIRGFSVPSTREDMLEFLFFALSNIDALVYKDDTRIEERKITDAWIAKTDQVYNKAQLVLGSDPDFAEIKGFYESKMKQVRKCRGNDKTILIVVVAVLLGIFLISRLTYSPGDSDIDKKIEKADKELKAVVEEIQTDVTKGDYDAALIKANTLYFDAGLSKSKSEDWDNQRESLIKLIEQKIEESK